MADLSSKIDFFIKNAPIKESNQLKEILDKVNTFANDVQIASGKQFVKESIKINDRFQSTHAGTIHFERNGVHINCKKKSKNDSVTTGQRQNKFSKKHTARQDADDPVDAENIKQIEDKRHPINLIADNETIEASNGNGSSVVAGLEGVCEDGNDAEKLSKLNEPLKTGWRRETVVSRISKNFEVQGTVRYYAPGSQVQLTDIGQIQAVLEKQSINFGVENFSFCADIIVGMYLQPFHSSSDAKYYYTTDKAMAERLKESRIIRSKCGNRKRPRTFVTSSSETDEEQSATDDPEHSVNDSLSQCSETGDEKEQPAVNNAEDSGIGSLGQCSDTVPSTEIKIKLVKIDESETYYDERGYLYSKNNTKQIKNTYFRCQNSKRYGCCARAKASGNDVQQSVLTIQHNHLPRRGQVDKVKFDKQLIKACDENPYLYPREIYAKTRKLMKSKIDPINIPLKGRYDTLIQRKKRKYVPKLPKSIEEFEQLIENYKQQYFYDERDLIFYRNVWKTKAGESNIVFVSESVLNKLKEMKYGIQMLMDGTFKVVPRHIKLRQLYIISIIYEGRCYPLAYILMEKKTMHSYNLIFKKLKVLMGPCEITNFMTDYEAASRKALKNHFPRARISGCFFHYVKAINKAARKFGLSKDEKFESAIQKTSALALLPNEFVAVGFKVINDESRALKYSLRWNRFKKYWKRQWSKANISVYGLEHRTNNFSESNNNSLNVLAKVKGPNIWILIEHLKTLEMDKTDELNQHSRGIIFKIPKSAEMTWLDNQIKLATKIFEKGQDVAKFLRNVTCGDKLENFFKERIFLDGIDEFDDEDSDEDSGIDCEDFIPNDFDVGSNFYSKPNKLKRKAEHEVKSSNEKRRRVVTYV